METVNYKCPACDAPLHFVAETQLLHCDYCESSFTAAEVEEFYAAKQEKADARAQGEQSVPESVGTHRDASKQDALDEYLKRSKWEDADSQNMASYVCSTCAAELICEKTTAVSCCPYCGNPTVVPGQMSDMLKPDYVIPFKKTKQDAVNALRDYYKKKRFLPKEFAEANHIEEIQGVYVPFWLYDATVEGNARFEATRVRVHDTRDETITETDYYECDRSGSLTFKRVPADGSTKMPDAHMDAIEPFDYSEMVDFSIAYMPGYLADRYDLTAQDCQERAFDRMGNSLEDELERTVVGYSTVSSIGCNSKVVNEGIAYALLPVWMLHTRYEEKDYLFAMNGQTGKLIGDLPISKKRYAAHFGVVGGIVAAVAFGLLLLVL